MKFPARKKRVVLIIVIGVTCSLMPLPVRDVDKDTAIRKSLSSLFSKDPVFLDRRYIPFYDVNLSDPNERTVYFINEARISDTVFADRGLQRFSESIFSDRGLPRLSEEALSSNFYAQNAIVYVTYHDYWDDKPTDDLHFIYMHGLLGGQCYRMTVWRNVWGVFVFYRCEWAS